MRVGDVVVSHLFIGPFPYLMEIAEPRWYPSESDWELYEH